MTAASPRLRHSPCVGVCKLDERSGYCLGCARTGNEIGAWSSLDEAGRDAIWQKLPERLATLRVRVRLLPWTGVEILEWVAQTVTERKGTWVTGAPGALAEFPCRPDRQIAMDIGLDGIVARAADGNFRLTASDRLRAFVFSDGGPIVLGQPRARLKDKSADRFTPLGNDNAAIDARGMDEMLFDIGLGRRFSRFCVRTGDAKLIRRLDDLAGLPWVEAMNRIGDAILAVGPTRVIESSLARMEVFAAVPPIGGRSYDGACTNFQPQFIASGDETPAALALPDYAAPVAIFYPGSPSA